MPDMLPRRKQKSRLKKNGRNIRQGTVCPPRKSKKKGPTDTLPGSRRKNQRRNPPNRHRKAKRKTKRHRFKQRASGKNRPPHPKTRRGEPSTMWRRTSRLTGTRKPLCRPNSPRSRILRTMFRTVGARNAEPKKTEKRPDKAFLKMFRERNGET